MRVDSTPIWAAIVRHIGWTTRPSRSATIIRAMIAGIASRARRGSDQEHGSHYADRQEDRGDKLHHAGSGEALGLRNIARGAAHQIARMRLVVEGEGQGLHGAKEVVAQVVGHAKGYPLAVVHGKKAGDAANNGDTQDQASGPEELAGVTLIQPLVDGLPDDLRNEQV